MATAYPTVYITENEAFRQALTPKEACAYDTYNSKLGRATKESVAAELGISPSTFCKHFWKAKAKLHDLGTRTTVVPA